MLTAKKMYYSISEVCSQTGLEPHVLRYWESEFSQLRPKKNRAGNRAYREKDIELINYIKHLLYEEKFTIPGAKKKLSESKESREIRDVKEPDQVQLKLDLTNTLPADLVSDLKKELREILHLLRP